MTGSSNTLHQPQLFDDVIDLRSPRPVVVDLRDVGTGASLTRRFRAALAIKRSVDIFVSGLALLILAPIAALLVMAVKTTSPGPAHFSQRRVGRDGFSFRIYKFRMMRDGTQDELMSNSEERERYIANDFKLPADDPRITRLGRLLRITSLDELPQLWNVFRGEMSLIGIRPLVADEIAIRSYRDQQCYFSMRPGMTGLWQVNGRSHVTDSDRRVLDREYTENWTLWTDLKIAVRTPAAVLHLTRAQ